MIPYVCAIAALSLAVLVLLGKVVSLRRTADDIRTALADRLASDTNTTIDLDTGDAAMRRLAADLNAQLRELRRRRLRYERGDRELKDAIANIAHDIRTPLTAICGYLDLLAREELPEPVRDPLRIIRNRVDALRRLSEELLRYSIAISAAPDEPRERISLNQAVEECVAAHYALLRQRGIAPDVTLPDAPVERVLGRTSLARILGNVLGNAAMYSDGDLSIALDASGTIAFRNRSARLDEVQVGRLFDRFYTVENGGRGTGLGLSIAKALTERMGGRIAARLEGGVFVVEVGFARGAGEEG